MNTISQALTAPVSTGFACVTYMVATGLFSVLVGCGAFI